MFSNKPMFHKPPHPSNLMFQSSHLTLFWCSFLKACDEGLWCQNMKRYVTRSMTGALGFSSINCSSSMVHSQTVGWDSHHFFLRRITMSNWYHIFHPRTSYHPHFLISCVCKIYPSNLVVLSYPPYPCLYAQCCFDSHTVFRLISALVSLIPLPLLWLSCCC